MVDFSNGPEREKNAVRCPGTMLSCFLSSVKILHLLHVKLSPVSNKQADLCMCVQTEKEKEKQSRNERKAKDPSLEERRELLHHVEPTIFLGME